MTVTDEVVARNTRFAAERFTPLSLVPSLRAVVITCADHRVDPAHVLGLGLGEAAIVRNAWGRITPAAMQTVAMMAAVVAQEGESGGFELIVLHHTDCGVARLAAHEDLLAGYFGIAVDELPAKHVTDPRAAVAADVEQLRSNPALPDDLIISGLVYDVVSGSVEIAVPARRLSIDVDGATPG
jgi:carbonic anhydrase